MREAGEDPADIENIREKVEPSNGDAAASPSLRQRLFGRSGREASGKLESSVGERLENRQELFERLGSGIGEVREGIERWGPEDRARAEHWFGSSDEHVRERLAEVFSRVDAERSNVRLREFPSDMDEDERENTFAYVQPGLHEDGQPYDIRVGSLFEEAGGPPNSKAGIVVHEMSHFTEIGGTVDAKLDYGQAGSRRVALRGTDEALRTADNFEYFFEEYERDQDLRSSNAR